MFHENVKNGNIILLDAFAEKENVPYGYVWLHSNDTKINGEMFHDEFNNVFAITNIKSGTVDEDGLFNLKKKIRRYVRSSKTEKGPTVDDITYDEKKGIFVDNKFWTPTIGNGYIRVDKQDENFNIKGLSKYIIIVYSTLPKLSEQVHDFIKINSSKNIKMSEFINTALYKKALSLSIRNAKRVTEDFARVLGLNINNDYDYESFKEKPEHSSPLFATFDHIKVINGLHEVEINEKPHILYNNHSSVNRAILSKKDKQQHSKITEGEDKNYDVFPFFSGNHNKIILVKEFGSSKIAFPSVAFNNGDKKLLDTKHHIKNIKFIEKKFVITKREEKNKEKKKKFKFDEKHSHLSYDDIKWDSRNNEKNTLMPIIIRLE